MTQLPPLMKMHFAFRNSKHKQAAFPEGFTPRRQDMDTPHRNMNGSIITT